MQFIDIPAGNLDGVPIAAFRMAETCVTIAEYTEFLAANPYREAPPEWKAQQAHPLRPVVYVSYVDALEFCAWAGFRLATGPEWEYACRAGGPDQPADPLAVAWCYENADGHPHDVATKAPNAFGLHDMPGNVWEWTSEAGGSCRVLRGGSWGSYADGLRASYRSRYYPSNRNGYYGFRCASHPKF